MGLASCKPEAVRAPRSVTILGSTGSVGRNTIDLIERQPAAFRIEALTANRNVEALATQARRLGAKRAVIDGLCRPADDCLLVVAP